jgi:uncharacterized protein (DUF58 family)
MQQRHAAQTYYYFALLLVGILLSTISRRLEPLYVILPLAVALIHSRLVNTRPALTLHCDITPLRAFEGDTITVHITVNAATDLPPTEIWHYIPHGATCPAGNNRFLLTLRAGATQTYTHTIHFPRRGKYSLGHLYVRIHAGADLQPWLMEHHREQVCNVYPHITPLPRPLPPLHTHISFGNYVSRSAGEGLEFAGVRPYRHGDRLRRIHWRTSQHRQALYVNDYYSERNADVVILLDTLASFGGTHNSTLDVATRTAASLAAHYLQHKDRVGLVNYGGVCTWVPPALGQRQLYHILEALLDTRSHFSYLTKDITLVPPRALPPGALIFVLTAFLDPRIEDALHDLLARRFPLVVLLTSPAYVMPTAPDNQTMEATERLWRLEMDLRLRDLRSLGVPVFMQTSEDPLSALHAAISRGTLWQRVR